MTTTENILIQRKDILLLVSSGSSSSSCSLELASLGSGEGLGVRVGNTGSSEMLDSLTGLAGSLKEQSVLASWGSQSQLVKSDNFSSSFQDSLASLLSDSKGTDSHLWDLEDSDVIGDGSNNDSDLVSISGLLHVADQTGDGERGTVDLAHEEPLEDDLVELGLGSSGQEPVELHQQPQVDVLALGLGPANLTVILVFNVNTHDVFSCRSESSNIS